MAPSVRTKNRGEVEASESIGEPRSQLRAAVDLTQLVHELLGHGIGGLFEPIDDLLVHLAVPLLVAAVRLLVLGLSHEALIPRLGALTRPRPEGARCEDRPA